MTTKMTKKGNIADIITEDLIDDLVSGKLEKVNKVVKKHLGKAKVVTNTKELVDTLTEKTTKDIIIDNINQDVKTLAKKAGVTEKTVRSILRSYIRDSKTKTEAVQKALSAKMIPERISRLTGASIKFVLKCRKDFK